MQLSELRSPADLQGLSLDQMRNLVDEIRQEIITVCMKNGGHLGASLGAVELAVALHKTFESPKEPIVWDVGHQAYAHKLLTGRAADFHTLRTTVGISGFLSREESKHDAFGAGHSSTALSAALGISWKNPEWTVAVVGDGGLTAGVALEALNNIQALEHGPLLLVLNDNQMSISKNVGALSAILSRGEASRFFEQFGFDCVGPVDGHDLNTLLGTLGGIKAGWKGKPILLHVLTQKGKGYTPAEESPAAFHGISPVQAAGKFPATGEVSTNRNWSDEFGAVLCRMAEKDPRIVAITAAMTEGTGLISFSKKFPDRFFDVGIAEPHAVTFAAGLATRGWKPVVAIYSTFLQRALDAVIHDVALQNLGVTFVVDRAGLVGADGPTHHGVFDLAYLGMIPNLTVTAPAYLEDIETLLNESMAGKAPYALRWPRGKGLLSSFVPMKNGIRRHQTVDHPKLIAVVLGSLCERVFSAARKLDPAGTQITCVSTLQAKPIPAVLLECLDAHRDAALLVVEEGVVRGGFGQALVAALKSRQGKTELTGLADHFVPHGSVSDLEDSEGFSTRRLTETMSRLLE